MSRIQAHQIWALIPWGILLKTTPGLAKPPLTWATVHKNEFKIPGMC